jgi:hypothetical protein
MHQTRCHEHGQRTRDKLTMIGGSFINELPSSIFQGTVSCRKQEQCIQNTNQHQQSRNLDCGKQSYGERLTIYSTEVWSTPSSLQRVNPGNGFLGVVGTSNTFVSSQTTILNMFPTNFTKLKAGKNTTLLNHKSHILNKGKNI